MSWPTDYADAMVETKRTEQGVTVTLTDDELLLIGNALNELCHGIRMDDEELRLRTGFTRQEIVVLLDQLIAIRRKGRSEEAART